MRWIFNIVIKQGLIKRITLGFFFLVLAKLVVVFTPVVFAYLLDEVSDFDNQNKKTLYYLSLLVSAYGSMYFFNRLFDELRALISLKVTQAVRSHLEQKCLESIGKRAHHDNSSTASYSAIISRTSWNIQTIFDVGLYSIVPTLIEFLLMSVIIWFSVGYVFSLLLLGVTTIYIIYTISQINKQNRYYQGRLKADNEIIGFIDDSITNMDVVNSYSRLNKELSLLHLTQKNYALKWWQQQLHLSKTRIIQALILSVGIIAALLLAVHKIGLDGFTTGDFVLVSLYMVQSSYPLDSVSLLYTALLQAMIQIRDVKEEFNFNDDDLSTLIKTTDNQPTTSIAFKSMRLNNISLSIGEQQNQILAPINLDLKSGESVAFVGKSGSGKSTAASIIAGLNTPTEGQILLDEKHTDATALNLISNIVLQESKLFERSILENIAYDLNHYESNQINRLIEIAHLGDVVKELPDGIDHKIGSGMRRFSGGEIQRLSIARALANPKPIMIFDEATRQLDAITENAIFDKIQNELNGFLFIVISHRLDNLVNFDRIVFFSKGSIIAQGTHNELMDSCTEYRELYNANIMDRNDAK